MLQDKLTFGSDQLFDFDKASLKPAAEKALDEFVEKLKSATVLNSVTVTGHTDGRGPDDYNDKLSLRRAETVRDYLVAHGIDPSKLSVAGRGKHEPIADNNTDKGRAANRRVEVVVDGYRLVQH